MSSRFNGEPGDSSNAASSGTGDRTTVDAPTYASMPRRQVVLTMGGLMLALLLASLDQTVVGTAMPRIIADLGGFDRFTWVTTAYLVASTTAVPIVGRMSDIYGRKIFYIWGIVIFLVGSVLSGLSQSIDQLIAFRAVQGIGGGTMMALAFVTVGDLFPPAERGKYQGMVAAVFGLSSVIGPTLGGFVTDNLSWHWIFYINLPLGVPILGLFIVYFPAGVATGRRSRLDVKGMALLVVAVVSLLVGLSVAGVQFAWGSPQIIGTLAFSAVATAAFVAVELRAPNPIMPLGIYRNRVVSISLIVVFCTGFGMFGAIIFIPLFFQGVLGASATSSGSFLTPMMLGIVAGAALSGQALSRLGGHYRLLGLAGLAVMGVGMYLVSEMSSEVTYGRAVLNIVIMGFGMGVTFPSYTIAVQNAVPHSLLGVATSATQFYRSIGGVLGLAVLGSLMASRFASELAERVPPAIQQHLPSGGLEDLAGNPQALVNPDALASLQARFADLGPQGAEMVELLVQGLRGALASAISDVFVVGLATVIVGFVVTLLLKEVPLEDA